MIEIEVNGKKSEIEENITIAALLDKIDYKGKMFVIEKNLEIVQKSQFNAVTLAQGDKLEIVEFAGGG